MPFIDLNDVCVDLPIYNTKGRSLKSTVLARAIGGRIADEHGQSAVVIRALSHISLRLQQGSRVGLVGANGAGKTTLLRVMAKIYPPTHGAVKIGGRITCLTDLNVGMDFEATGIENIRMRGTLLGLSRNEIAELVPRVAEFTELGEYLRLPIRCYSQGMMLRLAFGISTAVQPEIILLDEVVGAGDQSFAQKARERLNKVIDAASILVLASHNNEIIDRFCSSAIWLSQGHIVAHGPTHDILSRYSASFNSSGPSPDAESEALTLDVRDPVN
jgi:ABC-2 type transport system ATP-binding protein/lipopolysaccharide transport system ATP-binding protein